MDVEETAIIIRNAIRDIPKHFEENANRIKQLEDERNDLEHLIEFKKLNASEGFKAYKELREVLVKRRQLKDENEELKHLYPALKSLKNQLSQFDKAIKGIRNSKRFLEKRSYRCKVRKDLETIINGGDKNV